MLVPCGCRNKLLPMQWLKTTQILLFYSSGVRSPQMVLTGLESNVSTLVSLLEALGENLGPCHFQLPGATWPLPPS